jgi:hypothetical protein
MEVGQDHYVTMQVANMEEHSQTVMMRKGISSSTGQCAFIHGL